MSVQTLAQAIPDIALDENRTAFETFRRAYPEYDSTWILDHLRATEYARLDRQGHVYLDYTGGSLYAETQLRQHIALLSEGIFGNPHSKNLTSLAMTDLVEHTREYILEYFNAGSLPLESMHHKRYTWAN